jgi:hypothetical protein
VENFKKYSDEATPEVIKAGEYSRNMTNTPKTPNIAIKVRFYRRNAVDVRARNLLKIKKKKKKKKFTPTKKK